MIASLNLPRILRIGAGARHQLPATLAQLQLARPLLVTDPFMVSCGYVQPLLDALQQVGITCGLFADCVPDPTTDSVTAALALWHQGDYDCVIALGGGSSMDTAKAVAVMAQREGPMRQFKAPKTLDTGLPIIAIPTTAGTGSEVTRVAVITDSEMNEKMLCMGLGLMPVAALVDYELTLTMPYRLTADTGIDSLCHALEAYVSRQANPFTDTLALSAMTAIFNSIRTACEQPDNHRARAAMMLAATEAGMAFANSSVTLIHGMSRPIGALFHVPHGLSNAMLLPEVTAWSLSGATARYAACARAMGITQADCDETAAQQLVAALRRLNEDLAVPSPAAYGIDENQWQASLPQMAEQALASGSPGNNPLIPSAEDIVGLYQRVYA